MPSRRPWGYAAWYGTFMRESATLSKESSPNPSLSYRVQYLAKQLRKFGYNADLLRIAPAHGRVNAARRDNTTLKKMALQVPSRELRSIRKLQFHS